MSRLRPSSRTSAVCRPPSAVRRPPSPTQRVAWNDVALQFADALTRLRTPVVPGANRRTFNP